jgi:two-component system OmpR family response regulator
MADLPLTTKSAEQLHDNQRRAVVLIVDDDPDVCEVIAASLTEGDFQIECASSAEEALQRLATGRIDLALIDLLLPDRPGVEVAKRFAAGGAAVIIMSGALDAEDRIAGTGFKILRKPFRLKTLVAMVRDRGEDCLTTAPSGEAPLQFPEPECGGRTPDGPATVR